MADAAGVQLTQALGALQSATRGVTAAFLASPEGRFLASVGLSSVEQVRLGAIAAATNATASKGAQDRQLGDLKQVHIVGEAGSILILRAGPKAILTLVLSQGAIVEAVLQEAARTASRVAALT